VVERKEDLWQEFGHAGHRIAISTNGFIKKNGEAVMGRGCAKQATLMFEGLAKRFGTYLKEHGNVPGYLFVQGAVYGDPAWDRLMILPVKHNWWEKADIHLVTTSILFLNGEACHNPDWTFHVPRLGCGNGKLNWSDVRERMVPLPDNVVVHS
jgi:hypothetical protein